MKNRILALLLAAVLALSGGLVGCTTEVPEMTEHTLTISSTEGGSVTTPGEGTFTYDAGEVVNLAAKPDEGYQFVNWTGDVGNIANANGASMTITINGDYSIMANFEQEEAIYFADLNLEAAVREAIGKPTGLIYPSNLEGLTTLHAERRNIADLTGLDSCTNLESVYLFENRISDIWPLATLTSLINLQLWSNEISDISPLANLTNLTRLGLGINQISDISPLRNLTKLTWVGLPLNPIYDISPLANLTSLTGLGLSGYRIGDIALVVDLTRFTWLRLWNSQISDISLLASLTRLTFLDLEHNQITDISPLVENAGLSAGDQILLEDNPLNSDSINIYIPQLQVRGVNVQY